MSNRERYNNIKETITLHPIELTDNVGQMMNKINLNFLEIQNNGGGPMGPEGKQGVPGCRGPRGPAGRDGENAMDEWKADYGIGCNNIKVYDIEDVIMNKKCDRSLLLSNLSQDGSVIQIKETGSDSLTYSYVPEDFKDFKLKVYNSDSSGDGKHLHLMNSLAASINHNYLCHSGYSASLDWTPSTNQETLYIRGEKNSAINGHTHNIKINSDWVDLRRKDGSQYLSLDAGPGNSDYKGKFELVTLTDDQLFHVPDKTGYGVIWQDTLDHSEIWEVIDTDDLIIRYGRYNDGTDDVSKENDHWIYMDDQSEVRFKRLNNFILIDFHIGIRRIVDYDNFTIKNIQFKVDKATLGARTIGWDLFSVLQDEGFEDDVKINDYGFFTITPTDSSEETTADTFLISLQFHNDRFLNFSTIESQESYWFKGQIWATVIQEDNSCLQLEIEQENVCPYVEIYT